MKKLFYAELLALALLMGGCEAIGGIFNAGVYTGAFIIVFVVGLIAILVMRSRRK